MDYTEWAKEYYGQALVIKKKIKELKQDYKKSGPVKRSLIRPKIIFYEKIYGELMLTGHKLNSKEEPTK